MVKHVCVVCAYSKKRNNFSLVFDFKSEVAVAFHGLLVCVTSMYCSPSCLNLNLYTTVAKKILQWRWGRCADTVWTVRLSGSRIPQGLLPRLAGRSDGSKSTIFRTKIEGVLGLYMLAAVKRKHCEFFVADLSTVLMETQSMKFLSCIIMSFVCSLQCYEYI